MTNLDKETFWNPLMEKYPEAVKLFCDWIDEYKKAHNWKNLFGRKKLSDKISHYEIEETEWEGKPNLAGWDTPKENRILKEVATIPEAEEYINSNRKPLCSYYFKPVMDYTLKFHDIPIEFQYGILCRFFAEQDIITNLISFSYQEVSNNIKTSFELLNQFLTK